MVDQLMLARLPARGRLALARHRRRLLTLVVPVVRVLRLRAVPAHRRPVDLCLLRRVAGRLTGRRNCSLSKAPR